MHSIDYLVLLAYLVGIMAIGSLGFTTQKDLKDYFLGGRMIPWFVSMTTLLAAGISAITVIGMPALAFERGLIDLQIYIGMPVAAILAAWLVVPFFYRQDIITAYEYLEKRFDLKTRLLASVAFQTLYIFGLGTVVAAPAKVLSEISDITYGQAAAIVVASTAFYTIIGGIKAVAWTDLIQLFLLLGGPLIALAILIMRMDGGIAQTISIASQADKFRLFDTSFDLTTEVTVWAALTGLTVQHFSSLVVFQGNIQKYLTAKSVRESRRAVLLHGFGLLAIWTLFFLIGIALYSFHTVHPERLPLGADRDRIFVRFILNEMPIGLRGLVLSGILAAAMSTISAHMNSLSSVTLVDIWQRLFPSTVLGREVKLARWLTLAWAIAIFASSLVVVRWGGVVKAGLWVAGLFFGPLLSVFLLGMFTRRANGTGAFLGVLASMVTVTLVARFTAISWVWYALIGSLAGICFGYVSSLAFPAPSQERIRGYTLATQAKTPFE